MAERRMFAKTIIDSDAFLDMPLSTQALYFHLAMRADDEGFVNNPKKILRMIGASEDEMRVLLTKRFVISFDSGIVVIRHWRIHNYIQRDRFKPTLCANEKSQLELSDAKTYEIAGTSQLPACIQDVSKDVSNMDTQVRLGKVRLGKDRLGKESVEKPRKPKEQRHKYGQYDNVLLTDSDLSKLKTEFPNDWKQRIDRLSEYMECKGAKYKNHLATIRSWARKDSSTAQEQAAPKWEPVRHEDFEERRRREEQRLREFRDLKRRGMVSG